MGWCVTLFVNPHYERLHQCHEEIGLACAFFHKCLGIGFLKKNLNLGLLAGYKNKSIKRCGEPPQQPLPQVQFHSHNITFVRLGLPVYGSKFYSIGIFYFSVSINSLVSKNSLLQGSANRCPSLLYDILVINFPLNMT